MTRDGLENSEGRATSDDHAKPSGRLGEWLLVALPVVLQVVWGLWLAAGYSPAGDEIPHLMAGLVHWHTGRTDVYAVNPPAARLLQTVTLTRHGSGNLPTVFSDPYARPEFELSRQFANRVGPKMPRDLFEARLVSLAIAVTGGLFFRDLARRIFSCSYAASAAHLFFATSPCLMGHGSLVGPDVPGVATALAAFWGLARWLENPNWGRVWGVALLTGVALGTKFTNLPLAMLIPAAMLFRQRPGLRTVAQAVSVGVIALALLHLLYPLNEWGQPLGRMMFHSQALAGAMEGGNRFAGTWLDHVPSPLPSSALLGIDLQKVDFDRPWPAWLLGKWSPQGFPHYYAVAMMLKIPLFVGALAIIGLLPTRHTQSSAESWSKLLFATVALYCVVVFATVSLHTNLNHHHRYVFPAYPMVFLVAARALVGIAAASRWRQALVSLALVGAIFETSLNVADPIAGYNLAGRWFARKDPPLLSSGTDWGQGLTDAIDWVSRQQPSRPVNWLVQTPNYDPEKIFLAPFPTAPLEPSDDWLRQDAIVIVGLDRMYEDRCWTGADNAADWYRQHRHRAVRVNATMYAFFTRDFAPDESNDETISNNH